MIRYVDIDAFEEELRKETADCSELEQWSGADYSWMWRKKFYEVFETFPAADVIEVRHGYWVNDNHLIKCSICGSPIPVNKVVIHGEIMWEDNRPVKYCPNCGAKMMNEDEEMSKVSEMEMAYGEYLNG